MNSLKNIITISLTLFAVIDIIGSIPVILGLRKQIGKIESEKATLAAAVLMVLFLFFGDALLKFIGIDVSSFAIAGGLIIFILGMEMVLGITLFKSDPDTQSGSIVPVAFPLIAGAGTLTTLMSLRSAYEIWEITIGVVVNLLLVYLVLKSTDWLEKILGKGGIAIMRKIFGIVLLSIAIKLIKSNW